MDREQLSAFLAVVFIFYFTCIPKMAYHLILDVLNAIPVKLLIFVTIAVLTRYDMRLALLVTISFVSTLYCDIDRKYKKEYELVI